ncbi:MAG: response regulator transcription factor [Bacteroidales bacterium]|jgi:DNA-binding NarL/FixJ family response regulator|nr:response regulator transcription factor [Bacteroidales bacterium]
MSAPLKVAIADASFLMRRGMMSIFEQIEAGSVIELLEIDDPEQLKTILLNRNPDILIVNPSLLGLYSVQQFRKEAPQMKCVALLVSLADTHLMGVYDDVISMYDSAEQIRHKLTQLLAHCRRGTEKRYKHLSDREKDVLLCVIHGLTTKQIAERLCLSFHTVMTHRRNISAKLQIHTTAGLAIYAVANQLVTLSNHLPPPDKDGNGSLPLPPASLLF